MKAQTREKARAIRSRTDEEAPLAVRGVRDIIKETKAQTIVKVAKSLTAEEIGALIRFGLDQKKIQSLAKSDVKSIQGLLLERAREDGVRVLYDPDMTISAAVVASDHTDLNPEIFYNWLRKRIKPKKDGDDSEFWLVFNAVFKVQTTEFRDKFGSGVVDKLGKVKTDEWSRIDLKEKA